jgi:hypothetical protein
MNSPYFGDLGFKTILPTSKPASGSVSAVLAEIISMCSMSIVQLVVEFADVRILAFGTLNKPRSPFSVNPNAQIFLHPPGINHSTASVVDAKDVTEEGRVGFDDTIQEMPSVLISAVDFTTLTF